VKSADDGQLEGCVGFRVDAKEADVRFELLPKCRDGCLVLGEGFFEFGEQRGMLRSEVVDAVVHVPMKEAELTRTAD
jgi:hypothetical protein